MALNTYTLIPTFNVGGQFAQVVWHYQLDDSTFGTTKSAAQDLQQKFDTAHRTAMRSILPAEVSLVSYKGSCVSSPGGFEAFSPATGAVAGIITGGMSVSGLAPVLVHVPVDVSMARGRTFLPGISESSVESGILTAAYTTLVEGVIAAGFFQPLTLTGGGQATFGYWRAAQKQFVPIAHTLLSQNLGTMRRRMRPA